MSDANVRMAGQQALARVLMQLSGTGQGVEPKGNTEAIANRIWGDFRTAVAAALAELDDEQVMGIRHWQQVRHKRD